MSPKGGKLCASKGKKKHLQGTFRERDGMAVVQKVYDGFGDSDGNIADINQGQIFQGFRNVGQCAGTEYALLLVMSYDRYAAICCPLHYEIIMNRGACVQMVTASWFCGCVYGSIHVAGTFSVRFCGPNIVHQFFCDVSSLLTLACSGQKTLEYAFIIGSCCFVFICFILLIVSYVHIFSTVLRIPFAKGRLRSLSTCLPHLTVVTLFLFSGSITSLATNFKSSSSVKVLISVLYTVLPPIMNPVIYSLRNCDVHMALGKLIASWFLTHLAGGQEDSISLALRALMHLAGGQEGFVLNALLELHQVPCSLRSENKGQAGTVPSIPQRG
ncbi:olfactory receptor 14A16-like [Suricata suricatta]|uniref:olfactory receptor 14A16-like n=1 Tax=Suricata suricatta TaxID=37032 RepID=UPI00115579D7|nr:olfactory receptor 14A16-like [Suricata suricatta]